MVILRVMLVLTLVAGCGGEPGKRKAQPPSPEPSPPSPVTQVFCVQSKECAATLSNPETFEQLLQAGAAIKIDCQWNIEQMTASFCQ